MKIKKICEYLSDIGLLEIKDINYFLQLYSQIENNKCPREIDRLKISLFSYIKSLSKNDNQLFNICRSIIDSFINSQLVLKYKALNRLNNIFKNKINLKYNYFLCKLKIFNINKKRNRYNNALPSYYRTNRLEKNNKNNENNNKEELKGKLHKRKQKKFNFNDINNDPIGRITADDVKECTFAPLINEYKPYKNKKDKEKEKENVKSYTYYSPSFNIFAKEPLNKYNKNKARMNNNLNDKIDNMNILDNFYNYDLINRYNTYNDNRNNKPIKRGNSSAINIYNKQNNRNRYNNEYDYIDNNYLNKLYQGYNNRIRAKTPKHSSINSNEIFNNFLLKQDKHVKDVERKIMNLKIEERNKEDRECSFSPEIHLYNGINSNKNNDSFSLYQNNYNNFIYNNNNNNNYNKNKSINVMNSYYSSNSNRNNNINNICRKFESSLNPHGDSFTKELYNLNPKSNENKKRPNSISKDFFDKLSNENSEKNLRIEEKRKKDMEKYSFSPKIEYNDKYKVKGSFNDRQTEYIEKKKKLENKKEEDEKFYIEEMNKMHTIKSSNKDIIKRLYEDEAEKIKKKNQKENEDEKKTKKKNIIDWDKRFKDNKKNSKNNNFRNKNLLDIYDINNKKNKVIINNKKELDDKNNINIEQLIKNIKEQNNNEK